MLKNIFLHFHLVNKHRFTVLKLCIKAGIPFRGLVHDLSKYSPTEFFESAKYYNGKNSPIHNCKKENGYSKAWLHHKGRNKHHQEYWYDYAAPTTNPVIPYKYTVEMLCDSLSAGMTYKGKEFTKEYPLWYWKNVKNMDLFHPKMQAFFEDVFTQISKDGIEAVIKKSVLRDKYNKYCK